MYVNIIKTLFFFFFLALDDLVRGSQELVRCLQILKEEKEKRILLMYVTIIKTLKQGSF